MRISTVIGEIVGTGQPVQPFFISPTGDDNNPGTLAQPWSAGAIATKSYTILSVLAGTYNKRTVGGVSTSFYSAINAGTWAPLNIRAGTTLLSCDSNGNYSPGLAVFNPSLNGVSPVRNAAMFTAAGDGVTVDGLVVQNGSSGGFEFGGASNCTIQNCQVLNFVAPCSNFNPSGIGFDGGSGSGANNNLIYNCLIKNLSTLGPQPITVQNISSSGCDLKTPATWPYDDLTGITFILTFTDTGQSIGNTNGTGCTVTGWFGGTHINFPAGTTITGTPLGAATVQLGSETPYGSFGLYFQGVGLTTACTVESCLVQNVKSSGSKTNPSQINWKRNYVEQGNFGTSVGAGAATFVALVGLNAPANKTTTVDHNIIVGWAEAFGEGFVAAANSNVGTLNFTNNTIWTQPAPNLWLGNLQIACANGANPTANVSGNLFASGSNYVYWVSDGGTNPGTINSDNNALYGGTAMAVTNLPTAANGGPSQAVGNLTLAQWQAAGHDPHSQAFAGSPFTTTPIQGNVNSFLPSTSVIVNGVTCGAMDGTVGRNGVGCGFNFAFPSVRWAPGHYIQFGENDTQASKLNTITAIQSIPSVVGVVDTVAWGSVESTQGTYNWSNVQTIITACANAGKSYILDLYSRKFGTTDPTGTVPAYVVSNNWTYSRPAPNSAAGAALWIAACMNAKTAAESNFLTTVANINTNVVAISSDETVFGQNLTTTTAYSLPNYIATEINRQNTLRTTAPRVAVLVYTNFLNGDDANNTSMKQLFANALATKGILINGGPDAAWQSGNTGNTPGYTVLATDVSNANGVLCGVQNAETINSTTFANVFAEFSGTYKAQYMQWYESPQWGVVPAGTPPYTTQLRTFLQNNPVINTTYPTSWPGAPLNFNQVFSSNNFTGQASQLILVGTGTSISAGGTIQWLNATGHQTGGAFFVTKQPTGPFVNTFTFSVNSGLTANSKTGFAMVFQNSFSTPPAFPAGVSPDANLCGYGAYWNAPSAGIGIENSVAIKFDLASQNGNAIDFPSTGVPHEIGLYINGGPSANLTPVDDITASGVSLYSGHLMSATIVYDGSVMTLVLTDTVTLAAVRKSWPVNIAAAIGSGLAWIGFAGGSAAVQTNLQIFSWSFYTQATTGGVLPRLAAPTVNVPAGSYTTAQNVSLSGPLGALIYYTTNGQPPTAASTLYAGTPVAISASAFLQAVAIQSGFSDSLVAGANYIIGPANTPTINFPNGFAGTSLVSTVGIAAISGANLQLTNAGNGSQPANPIAGAGWYVAPVNVSSFNTVFTLQLPTPGSNTTQAGLCFVIQNQPPTSQTCVAGSGHNPAATLWVSGGILSFANPNGYGYSGTTGSTAGEITGISSSVAIKFEAASTNGTGLYTNGADVRSPTTAMTGLDLLTGNHAFQVTLDYNNAASPGNNLKMTVKDLTTLATFTTTFAINIPVTVNGNTAYVGFTAGSFYGIVQEITTWKGF